MFALLSSKLLLVVVVVSVSSYHFHMAGYFDPQAMNTGYQELVNNNHGKGVSMNNGKG